jgi:phage tail-like protein
VPNPGNEPVVQPFTAFNFSVEITPEGASAPLCSAAFAECDGLEMTREVKTIREGGNNGVQIRLSGPITYGQLTLRRGMTASFHLWDWFEQVTRDPRNRATGQVAIHAANHQTRHATFVLERCIPLRVKAPALNAKDGTYAVEELQLAYQALRLERPGGGGGG